MIMLDSKVINIVRRSIGYLDSIELNMVLVEELGGLLIIMKVILGELINGMNLKLF